MHRFDFERWLDEWGRAWESRNPDAFLALLAPDVAWMRDPFSPPLGGHKQVYDTLAAGLHGIAEITFAWEVLAFDSPRGTAHWQATLTPRDAPPAMFDGVLVADFDANGQCQVLREWWNRPTS